MLLNVRINSSDNGINGSLMQPRSIRSIIARSKIALWGAVLLPFLFTVICVIESLYSASRFMFSNHPNLFAREYDDQFDVYNQDIIPRSIAYLLNTPKYIKGFLAKKISELHSKSQKK